MTGNLDVRLFEHIKQRDPSSFVARYNLDRLVFFETYPTANEAITREKQLKGGVPGKKWLIRAINPMGRNLLDDLKIGTVEITEGKDRAEKKTG